MARAGSAVWIDVLPAMNKLAPGMTKGATAAARTAGTAAGKQFSAALSSGAAGGGGATALVAELQKASKQAQRVITAEKTAIYQARNAEKAATQGVQAAEARLAEQRQKYAGGTSQVIKAEQALTVARGKAGSAALKTELVEERLKTAFRENSVIANQLGTANAAVARQTAVTTGALSRQAAMGAPLAAGLGKAAKGLGGVAAGALSTVKPLAGMAAGFGAIVGIGKVISLGNEYTATMNELGAVTSASGAMMKQFGTTARSLGSDLQLPATSGKDAAAVMLELAKGGFTAQGAMDAARGTILLAAAAQVDGATAAEIQSNAINQFGLSAKNAGQVADVLANTANAASGGITDIATSMKYVGPVAKALGVNIQSTASSVGLLANAGLKGDTAGTALRGMLASLSAPSKQASNALDELGVNAFDSSGKFVGMRSVIDQLSKAQKRMSTEAFASNSAIAFGREPLAAVTSLARLGAKGYDEMYTAVGKAGGAAAVANAKMKGLGGAMDKLQSQLEDVALGIYDTVAPAITAGVNFIAKGLDGAGGKVSSFLKTAGGLGKLTFTGKGAAAPAIAGIDPAVVSGILKARDVIMGAYRDLATFTVQYLIPSLKNIGVAVGPLVAILVGGFLGALRAVASVLATVVGPALLSVTGFLRDHQGVVIAAAAVIGYLVLAYKAQQLQLAILAAGGLKQYIAATKLGVFWSNASAAAMTVQKGALLAYRAVVFTAIAVTRGWTAAQLTLNAAQFANPIGLVVIAIVAVVAAIAGLVAGIIWAYKNVAWFRNGINALWTGIMVGVKAVGAAAVWLWQNIFVPAWQGIAAAAQWAWGTILKPAFDGIMVVVRGVAAVFTWWWQNVTMPVFRGIAAVAGWMWNTVSAIFELAIAMIKFALAPVFSFLGTVAKATWSGIVTAVQWAWGILSLTFTTIVGFVRNTLGVAFSWLYANIVKPTFAAIGVIVQWVWSTVIKPVWDSIIYTIQNVLAPAFSFLYRNAIKPAWDGIKLAVKVVWDWLKPVFDKIADVAKNTIPAAFTVMKDGISKAWEAVKTAAKAPIKFVVNTVVNDALIKNFNRVAKVFGTSKISEISLPKGFAGGGVIPGYQAAKRDEVLTPMRKGEGVLVPEVVRALGHGFVHNLNAAGNSGGVGAVKRAAGYATGGVVGAVTSGWDWVKGSAGKAWDWTKNAAETAANVVSDPMGTLGKLVKGVIGKIPGAGRMVDMAGGMASKTLSAAVAALKKIGDSDGGAGTGKNGDIPKSSLMKVSGFNPGPGVGAMGGYLRLGAARAWQDMQRASGGALSLTEGYRDLANQNKRWAMYKAGGNLAALPGTSVHGLGKAADIGGGQAWVRANGAKYGWVNTGLGFSQREPWHFEYKGRPSAAGGMSLGGVVGMKPTLMDAGGVLPKGPSLVMNKLSKPEYALPEDRLVDVVARASAENGGGDGRLWRDLIIQGGDDTDKQVRGFTKAARAIKRGGPV